MELFTEVAICHEAVFRWHLRSSFPGIGPTKSWGTKAFNPATRPVVFNICVGVGAAHEHRSSTHETGHGEPGRS